MLSPYFDHVEHELGAAVRRQAHLPWFVRLRSRRPRALAIVLASLVIVGPAYAAVALLQQGTQVGPNVPPTPSAFDGVAIKSSIQLLPLRTPDPGGGLAWGMRMIRTTRGLVCLQVGRVGFGTVGVLGRDGAYRNDGRFHPLSPNYQSGPACSVPDARGDAFVNVATWGVAASGLLFGESRGQGCVPPRGLPPTLPPPARQRREQTHSAVRHHGPVCPTGDLRNLYYGLLGPDAVSITYPSSSGKLQTTRTGPDGSYLIVLGGRVSSNNDGYTYDSGTVGGPLLAIRYRDGHTCRPGRCEPVGYVSPAGHIPTPAQVASPITARVELNNATAWCVPLIPPGVPKPCRGPTPPGFQRLKGGPPQALVLISWISRVAVRNGHSYYYETFAPPRVSGNPNDETSACGTSGQFFGQTNADYTAGQRVVDSFFVPLTCHGIAHGNVVLVIKTGPSAPAPTPAVPGQSIGREVGNFSVALP